MLFPPPKILSLVLNISLRAIDGQKIADGVRNELIELAGNSNENQLYLSSSPNYDRRDIAEDNGKWVAMIGNWRPQETAPRLSLELQKATRVMAYGDVDDEGCLCLITDRYKLNDEAHLAQVLGQIDHIWRDVKVIVITIGDHYDFEEYENICDIYHCKYLHLSNPNGIKSIIYDWMGN